MSRRLLIMLASVLASFGALMAQQSGRTEGTARIEGRVVGTDGSSPLRRALVTVSGDVSLSRSTISDDNGAFVFANLPAGQFSLTATRPAFISSSYGAKSPGAPGTRISLTTGQTVTGALIRMARGAVIAGTVRSENSEPMVGIQVRVTSTQPSDPVAARIAVGLAADSALTAETDDRGSFRVFGLPAGSYLVAAVAPQRNVVPIELVSAAEIDETFQRVKQNANRPRPATGVGRRGSMPPMSQEPRYGLPPVFYPGTADVGSATPVTVALGEERTNIDFVFAPTVTVAIEGEVVSPDGPLPRVQLTLTADARMPAIPGIGQGPTAVIQPATLPAPSGRFRYTGVTAGRYILTARTLAGQVTAGPGGEIIAIRSGEPGEAAPPGLWAEMEVVVTSVDMSGLQLRLRPALNARGRVQFDATTLAPPANFNAIRLSLQRTESGTPLPGRGAPAPGAPAPLAVWQTDGTFTLASVMPGTYKISATMTGPSTGWWLRSAIANGRDLLDEPLVVTRDDQTIPPIVVTYSDRHTRVTGTLQTPAGAPATDYFIVMFTAERRFWRPDSRRLIFTRPATNGQFDVRDLPPGDYYIAALDDLDTASWQTPPFLDELVPGSLRLSLAEGETKTQDLRIAR